tara:strand:+ start:574 stop:1410 length:837 start_codon:yes stop_codon:yes gene_type:complete
VKIIAALCLVFSLVISCETNDVLPNFGCMDVNSCNYSEEASADDGSCFYANECIGCDGPIDTDGDGVGDCDEVEGCTDSIACNYNPIITIDDGSCEYPLEWSDCAGNFVIVLNEVLYDPSNSGLLGDANGDGVYVQDEDEFIELYNNSFLSLDISGFRVFDAEGSFESPKHIVPDNTFLQPQQAFVLFGGGVPSGDYGDALVQICSNDPMNLNNAGDLLTITDDQGNIFITFDIEPLSNNPNESFTRSPDLTGEFIQHSLSLGGLLYSPGMKTDGNPF